MLCLDMLGRCLLSYFIDNKTEFQKALSCIENILCSSNILYTKGLLVKVILPSKR